MATLKLNGNSSGFVNITTNAAAANNTLTLPDVTDRLATITTPTFLNASGAAAMTIDASGNVGIGSATPSAKLVVSTNTSAAQALNTNTTAAIIGTDGTLNRLLLDAYGSNSNITFRRAVGTAASPSAVLSGTTLGSISAFGYGATGYSSAGRAVINLIAAENWTDTAQGTQITFQTTASGTTTLSTALYIANTGNVGIATTTPTQTLDVQGNVNVLNTVIMGSSFLRNRIINGGMSVDQRNSGASQTITAGAALAYTVDRFYAYCTGANVTGQRIANTINNPASNPSQFVYQFTGAASVTGIGFGHRIEAVNCWDLAGSTATLSVNLANGLLSTVTWTASYANSADSFGTLASPTVTQIATGTFTVTAALSRYSVSIPIPTAATTGIQIVFTVGAQTSATWQINNVQLEPGPVATPFERRQFSQELALCQRYYWKFTAAASGGYQQYCAVNWESTTAAWGTIPFKVSMRVQPTLSQNGLFTTNYGAIGTVVLDPNQSGTEAAGVGWSNGSGGTNGYSAYLRQNNNTAGFLAFSAEL